ncbi:Crp/Fnr family transcriptional regulator [Oryzibacter oryziterrae]|uniref:Crp/Fnr family transcriptional regulator n=1 Tax=Oryzibacter oryziterrae TaxID=2766474 RepID=UPI001F1591FC|nr:Crp/Fnr family transcriptional regulator [Oryzibacter oryziterrae]
MSLENDIHLLGQVPILSDFSEDKLRLLAFSSENRSYRDGQRLFAAGDRADCAFIVSQGQVALSPPDNAALPTSIVGPGEIIGELSLIVDGERPYSAVARGAVTVIQIRRPLFRRMLDEFPEIAESLQQRIAEGLRGTSAALMRVRDRIDRIG